MSATSTATSGNWPTTETFRSPTTVVWTYRSDSVLHVVEEGVGDGEGHVEGGGVGRERGHGVTGALGEAGRRVGQGGGEGDEALLVRDPRAGVAVEGVGHQADGAEQAAGDVHGVG